MNLPRSALALAIISLGCGGLIDLPDQVAELEARLSQLEVEQETFKNTVESDYVNVNRRELEMGKNGTQVCNELGQACLFLSTAKSYNIETNEFVGYTTFFCDSSEIRKSSTCPQGFMLGNGRFTKALESTSTDRYSGNLCLQNNSYTYVYCIDTIE